VLADLVARCLAKSPDDRTQSASDVLAMLEETVGYSASRRQPEVDRPRWRVGAAILLLLMAGGVLWRSTTRGGGNAEASIAVLPFALDRGDVSQQYLADGVTEELITAWARAGRICVIARSMAVRYRGAEARRTSKELNVSGILTG